MNFVELAQAQESAAAQAALTAHLSDRVVALGARVLELEAELALLRPPVTEDAPTT